MRRTLLLTALIAVALMLGDRVSRPVRAQQKDSAGSAASSAPHAVVIASGAQLADIRGLAVDAAGNVYISSKISPAPQSCVSRDSVVRLSVTLFSNCTAAPAEDPSGIAVNSLGSHVFLANRDHNSIRLLNMLTGKVALVPQSQSSIARGSNGPAPNVGLFLLAQPAGLAMDRAGDLFVADRGNNRVLGLGSAANEFENLSQVLDAAAVAVDGNGQKLFIASPASNRIYQLDLASGDISVLAGTGALPDAPANSLASQSPAPRLASQVALSAPVGIAVDAAGNVFISDTGSNAILQVDAKTNLLSRITLGSALDSPGALAINRNGDLFVADRGNHRVVEFAGVASQQPTSGVTLTPVSSDFGNQPTGGTTPQQAFVLTNNSGSALTLATSDFSFSGSNPNDFMQTNNCAGQLANTSSCQISVAFAPQGQGGRSASLMVNYSSTASPETSALTGAGDDFQLTAANQNATMQTVVPGSPGNYSLSVTPDSVFGGTVALNCPTRLPDSTLSCSVSPTQLTIIPGQASSFSVTIKTLSGKTPGTKVFPDFPPSNILFGGAALLAFFLVMAVARRQREDAAMALSGKSTRRRRAWAISALAFLCVGAAGCYHAPASYNPVTPAGIYRINIIGTAQNASRAITLTLNVE